MLSTFQSDLRICFITSHISNSYQFVSYQDELKKNGFYNIHIIIKKTNERLLLVKQLEEILIPVYVISGDNLWQLFFGFFKIRSILRSEKINLVHTSLPYGNLIGQMAAMSLGIKKRITTCENASWAYDYKSKKQWLIDKFTFLVSKKIIATSLIAHEFLIKTWRVHPNKLFQINHAINIEDYENVSADRIDKIKQGLSIRNSDFVIGMIARTEFWKGHEYAVEAIKKIANHNPNIKLLICGSEGFDHQKLLNLISKNKLQNQVKFVGFMEDPIAFLKSVNVQLHIPINKFVENGGICILEGMAAEIPQILTLSGYAYQSAKHMENAFVVSFCNSDEVATALIYNYENRVEALKLAKKAKDDVKEHFSMKKKLEKHLQLYINW